MMWGPVPDVSLPPMSATAVMPAAAQPDAPQARPLEPPGSLREAIASAAPAWIAGRLLMLIAAVLAAAAAEELVPDRSPLGLVSWDGDWYRQIAEGGYGGLPREALRFFPLLPLLGKALSPLFLGSESAALVVIANGAALAAAVLLHLLVRTEGHGRAAADRSVWLLAVFPAAFVLVMPYAEALMLALAIGAMLAYRRERWWLAALLGALAALSRPLGVALVVPAVIEVARHVRRAAPRVRLAMAAAVTGPLVGLAAYLLWVWARFGDPWLPLSVQEADFRGEFVDPVTRIARAVGDLAGDSVDDGLHLPFALAFVVLIVVLFARWPASYGALAAVVVLFALSAENLNSLERYGLNAFPLVLALTSLTARPGAYWAALALGGGGFVALAGLALLGAYVP